MCYINSMKMILARYILLIQIISCALLCAFFCLVGAFLMVKMPAMGVAFILVAFAMGGFVSILDARYERIFK